MGREGRERVKRRKERGRGRILDIEREMEGQKEGLRIIDRKRGREGKRKLEKRKEREVDKLSKTEREKDGGESNI